MEFIDYYKILGIANTATEGEIKSAYRKLARKYHPDLHPDDKQAELKFKEINEANEVLSNPEKRKKYNEYGKDWKHADTIKQNQQEQQAHRNTGTRQHSKFSGNFSDFFESLFSHNQNDIKDTQTRGQDFKTELQLNLSDVYKARKQTIMLNGENIRLSLHAGVANGQVIKLKGHGAKGANGAPNGDLYITFSIANDTKFEREGNDLHASVDLDLYTSLLGGQVLIDTFDGKVSLKVAPETKSGTKVRLKGKGFPVYKQEHEFGDLFVTYQVKLPVSLSDKEKELFTELQKIRNPEHK